MSCEVTVYMGAGDLLVLLRGILQENPGVPDPLVINGDIVTVTTEITRPDGTVFVGAGTTVITDQPTAEVTYTFVSGETDTPGLYKVRFKGLDNSARQKTWPSQGHAFFRIT